MSRSKKSKTDPDVLFGELRSVLQQPHISSGTRTHLWGLCVRMYKFYPTQFNSLWRPYLESYATHWKPEMVEITSANGLKRAVKMMPTARFTLTLEQPYRQLISQSRRQQVRELMRSPLLDAITTLRVTDHEQSHRFLTSPLLRDLTRVHLHMRRTSAIDLLVQVATSAHKDTLELIEIDAASEHQDDPYAALTHLEPLPELRTLILQDSPISTRGLHALSLSGLCDNLEHLNLSNTHINEAALINLTKSHKVQLKTLSLGRLFHVSEDATELCTLLSSPQMGQVESLNLSMSLLNTSTSTTVLHTLATIPNNQLRSLNISSNHIHIKGIQEIANSSNLDHLRELSLLDVKLSLPMVECLATHPFFSRLEALHIQAYQLDEAQKHMLTTSTTLKPAIAQSFAQ